MTKDEIYAKLHDIIVNDFEVPEEKVTPNALLTDELDLDSIDFIDMVVKMKEFVPERVSPEVFDNVKTVQDVVDKLEPYINKENK